ncbi:MAG: hypothetical protein LKG27_06305 [Clostridiaceae bacterium]|jgi:hypothetical protein|nr:hypothetical protein [Clostridiaceae bacterium]
MGLAAGQARLLTITARKSDCEFRSMSLSHQKLALSRQLEDVSNDYQSSLSKTKLVYDYSGSDAGTQDLTYGLLMNPSALNDYVPTLVTASDGKVVLSSQYAAAAQAAGIPKEGLASGSLPSDTVRNKFIESLASNGLITKIQSTNIQNVAYNQKAGLGAAATVSSTTANVTYQQLMTLLKADSYDVNTADSYYVNTGEAGIDTGSFHLYDGTGTDLTEGNEKSTAAKLSIGDILDGDYTVIATGQDGQHSYADDFQSWVENLSCLDDIMSTFEGLLGTGESYTTAALNYARQSAEALYKGLVADDSLTAVNRDGKKHSWKVRGKLYDAISNDGSGASIGVAFCRNKADDDLNSSVGINISNFAKAYLTYFEQYMQGVTKSAYSVGKTVQSSDFATDAAATFDVVTDTQVSADDQKLAGFYDTMLNMICTNGWTENSNVSDKDYFQNMLQSGGFVLSKIGSDKYYYQENYATDTNIKTEEDTTAVAEAEAKYNAEKQRLSNKEDTIDLQMKNLDTEISALTTEYDTVKSAISKNIERTFKRYSA